MLFADHQNLVELDFVAKAWRPAFSTRNTVARLDAVLLATGLEETANIMSFLLSFRSVRSRSRAFVAVATRPTARPPVANSCNNIRQGFLAEMAAYRANRASCQTPKSGKAPMWDNSNHPLFHRGIRPWLGCGHWPAGGLRYPLRGCRTRFTGVRQR